MEEEDNLKSNWSSLVQGWHTIQTIDAHTGGEPLRIVLPGGIPSSSSTPSSSSAPPVAWDDGCQTVLDRRRRLQTSKELDTSIRKVLMYEPRGHNDMYGCIICKPNTIDDDDDEEEELETPAHFGVIFLHNEGYSTMCGHGIIAVTKVVIELGVIQVAGDANEQIVEIDSPAGRIVATAHYSERHKSNSISKVSFENVPSFVVALDQIVSVPGIGNVRYDLAYGGAFYAYVQVNQFDGNSTDIAAFSLEPKDVTIMISVGMRIKNAIMETVPIHHPSGEEDLGFLYGTIFVGSAMENKGYHHSRNVCIFAEGEVDRSPTGTGVSGRAAIHVARGELSIGQEIVIESIVGSTFSVSPVKTVSIPSKNNGNNNNNEKSSYEGIIPRVCGTAYITGRHEFVVDPDDPFRDGFLLR